MLNMLGRLRGTAAHCAFSEETPMLCHAKNGSISMDGTTMDYIRFGCGKGTLIMLPGLGDGLRSMKGTALPMALLYRAYAKEYTVWAFSRKNDLPEHHTTRDMAQDLRKAMDVLGIRRADLFGVSMGGMIAQHFAADYPERVGKLVLAVTSPRTNPILEESLAQWLDCVERDDHTALMQSNLKRIYTEGYCRRNGWMIPIAGKLTKPRSYDRFRVQAEACREHDAFDRLSAITAPTLVIGGGKDLTLGVEASRELAANIPGARLRIYPEYGHGVYEEARTFHADVMTFLR